MMVTVILGVIIGDCNGDFSVTEFLQTDLNSANVLR